MSRNTETGFLNYYECPRCYTEWDDEWSCACDDDCPTCGLTCSPFESEETEADEPEVPLDTPSLDTSFHDHEMDVD